VGIFGKSKSEKAVEALGAFGVGLATIGVLGLAAWAEGEAERSESAAAARKRAEAADAEAQAFAWKARADRAWASGERTLGERADREARQWRDRAYYLRRG
jgi:hypothetical protein